MVQGLLLLSDEKFWNLIRERHLDKGGVYKIIAVREGKRVPISRFLGTDHEGVLYIGKATSFINRVIKLKQSIAPTYGGVSHICGRRYKANPNIALLFPYNTLHVELIEVDDPGPTERRLLSDYSSIYGEVPPLNAI